MRVDRKKIKTPLLLLSVIAVLVFIFVLNVRLETELRKFGRYTVGKTLRFTLSARSGRGVIYEYYVNGIRYESMSEYLYDAKVPDGKYLIKFSSNDPEEHKLFLNRPVPSNVTEPPSDGWKVRPW